MATSDFPTGNILSLIESIIGKCREDGTHDRFHDYIVTLAQKAGLSDDEIRYALSDEYLTVIYRP
jgi:hypothetical protein